MRDMPPIELAEFETQPFRFTASAQLDADPHAVFAELGDPSLWFPLVSRSVWRTGATSGVGAKREVDVRTFGRFREHMLARELGARLAFTMIASTTPLFSQLGEDYRLIEAQGGTRLEWAMVGTPTIIGRAVTPGLRLVLRAMFARSVRNLERRAGSVPRQRGKHVS